MRKDAIEAGSAGVALYEACRATCLMLEPRWDSFQLSIFAGYIAIAAACLIFIPTPADRAAAERGELDP